MSDARARILGRLRAATPAPLPPSAPWVPLAIPVEGRLARFTTLLQAAHAEVHSVDAATWPEALRQILAAKGVRTLMHAPATEHGIALGESWANRNDAPQLVAYDRPVEDLKSVLVEGVDAAITSTLGGIAETGSLVLWPNNDEPRLLSLLPPIHVAIIKADSIAATLADLMTDSGWAQAMPTNALLISGPSKTADIEQTLAYGVHGPKELIVLVMG